MAPCGPSWPLPTVLAPLLILFVIDNLQDHLSKGVYSSLFANDSALWVHTPRLEDAVLVLQEGVREVYQWSQAKKFTLNLEKCEVSFSADVHEANLRPVVEVKGTILRFDPIPPFLGVLYNRTLSMKPQADRKAAILSKGRRVLAALAGSDWGWNGDLLRKVYQTSLLRGVTYAGGGWLHWLSTSAVGTLNQGQNCNLRVITGQVASTPNEALRLEAGVQSFGYL
jgi:hypothetical protein